MNRFEKAAYGGDDEYGEYDRWSDGGPAWGLNKQKMIDMTRLFAAEAARRKAQLQFHSDRYGADMYSPEEAVKRISAVANDKDLDDVENLPNYYNLQYPLKPRSGILETLRLKSPGPIDDWGPEGHPMEAVNRALMGMRSRSGSLKKAAAFGAMMGKRAAEDPMSMAPAPRKLGAPAGGTPPGKQPLSFEQNNKMRNQANAEDPRFSGAAPKRFNTSEEAQTYARGLDTAAGKTTEQRVAAMTPEQRQARTNQAIQGRQNEATQQYRAQTPDWEYQRGGPKYGQDAPYGLTAATREEAPMQPDHGAMMMMAGVAPGIGGLGGTLSDAMSLGKSFIPSAGQGTRAYLGNIGKNALPFIEPSGVAKAIATGSKSNTGGLSGLASAGLNSAASYGQSKVKGVVRGGGPASAPYGQIAASRPNTPQPAMAGNPRNISGTTMTGTIPNVPRG